MPSSIVLLELSGYISSRSYCALAAKGNDLGCLLGGSDPVVVAEHLRVVFKSGPG
jgi:hypothetical protein